MKHRVSGRRLGLPTDQRMALLKNLVTSLLWHGSVETTEARAKEARGIAEKLITLAKEDTLHRRRLARRRLMPRTGLVRMKEGSSREAPSSGEVEKEVQAGRRAGTVENSVRHLFKHVAPQYQDRPGGYSRIVRVGTRQGDGTEMVRLQLVDYKLPEG